MTTKAMPSPTVPVPTIVEPISVPTSTFGSLSHIREAAPEFTSSGEKHGLIGVVANSVPNSEGKRFKEPHKVSMQKLRDEESRMVKVQYINTKGPEQRLERPYMRWDGDPILSYKFIPEQIYEIPKGLVDEINNKRNPKRSGLIDPKTKEPIMMDKMEHSEHRFVPVSF